MLHYKNREIIKREIENKSISFHDFIDDWKSGDIPEDVFIDEGCDRLRKLNALFEVLKNEIDL